MKRLRPLLLLLLLSSQLGALAQNRISLTLPQEMTSLRLALKAEDEVSATGLKEDLICDGMPHLYTATAKEVILSGRFLEVDCSDNALSAIDLSKTTAIRRLNCARNNLSALNVSSLRMLSHLDCSDNTIQQLNLENNAKLIDLNCSYTGVVNFDLTNQQNLEVLRCQSNSNMDGYAVTTLHLEKCPRLKVLDCTQNKIRALDLSQNTELEELYCGSNNISSLSLSANKKLKTLVCSDNFGKIVMSGGLRQSPAGGLTKLDLSANTALTTLICGSNDISQLSLSTNTELEHLDCSALLITELDVKPLTKLRTLYCSCKTLNSIDLSQSRMLEEISCNWTGISEINLSNCPNLKTLSVGHNKLSDLDLSGLSKLETLSCYSNKNLKTLNLSHTPALRKLECYDCMISELDLAANKQLTLLSCYENQFSADGMSRTIASLPKRSPTDQACIIAINTDDDAGDKNVVLSKDVKVARDKSWLVLNHNEYSNRRNREIYYGSDAAPCEEVVTLTFNKKKGETISFMMMKAGKITITGLKEELSPNADDYPSSYTLTDPVVTFKGQIEGLEISENQGLAAIDLSKASNIRILSCPNNEVTGKIDLEDCFYLSSIDVHGNKIEEVELGEHPYLLKADFSDNQISKWSAKAGNLSELKISNNRLTKLDIKESTRLKRLYCQHNELKELKPKSALLRYISCFGNAIDYRESNDLVEEGLPDLSTSETFGEMIFLDSKDAKEHNAISPEDVAKGLSLGWDIYDLYGNQGVRGIPHPGTVGVDAPMVQQVKIYPNPTVDLLHLEGFAPDMELLLIDLASGQLCQTMRAGTDGRATISLSRYPAGLYLIQAGGEAYKIVKE